MNLIKKRITKHNFSIFTVCLYIFTLSFLNYTPFYIAAGLLMTIAAIVLNKPKFNGFIIFWTLSIIYFTFHTFIIAQSMSLSFDLLVTIIMNFVFSYSISNIIIANNIEKNIVTVVKSFVFSSFIACIFIIIYSGGTGGTGRLAHGVARPFSDTPYLSQEIGNLCAISLLFLSYYLIVKKDKKTLFLIPFFCVVLLLTGARSSFLLFFGGIIIFYLLISKNNYQLMKRFISIVLIGILIIILLLKNDILYQLIGYRFEGIFSLNGIIEGSASTRFDLMKATYKLILNRPILGYGLNCIFIYLPLYSHCNFLELGFSVGVIYTIIYYIFFIFVLFRLFKNNTNIKDKSMNKFFFCLLLIFIIEDVFRVSFIDRPSQLMFSIVCAITLKYREVRLTRR